MFHYEGGLKLTQADLAVDFRRRQPRAFISHAHADHMARHEYALCTPETSALYQFRLGPRRTLEMSYRQPVSWGGLRLTTYPAGHCLGAAMLLAESQQQSLLYTGDFKLGPSVTAEEAELPRADTLVIESTFGDPSFQFPPRRESIERLLDLVRRTLRAGDTPVVLAYALGKGQEVTRVLTDAGFGVLQHRRIFEISRIYESLGVALGRHAPYCGRTEPEHVVMVPPGTPVPEEIRRPVRIAVTGWAVEPRAKYRLRANHAVALSDHADYGQLLDAIERVSPKKIYCTHGPDTFVDRLRDAGLDAEPLAHPRQRRLFR